MAKLLQIEASSTLSAGERKALLGQTSIPNAEKLSQDLVAGLLSTGVLSVDRLAKVLKYAGLPQA